jgi:hypothetical protein
MLLFVVWLAEKSVHDGSAEVALPPSEVQPDGVWMAASVGVGAGSDALPVSPFAIPCAYVRSAGTFFGRFSAAIGLPMVFVVVVMSVRLVVGESVVRSGRVVGGCTSFVVPCGLRGFEPRDRVADFAHFRIDFGHRRPNLWK